MSAMCGVFFLILSKSSYDNFIPTSFANASKCKIPLVDPPTAFNIVIAFSNDSNVKISRGLILSSSNCVHALPVSYTIFPLLSSSAGGLALPGNAIPIASEIDAIVLAVNIPPQDPALGHAVFSIFFNSSSEIFPASYEPTAS